MKNKKRGFTLVELLVATGLIVLVFGFVSQFLVTSTRLTHQQDDAATRNQQARLMVMGLRRDLLSALSVRISKVEQDTTPAAPAAGDYLITVSDGQLCRTGADGKIQPIYSNAPVEGLIVTYKTTEDCLLVIEAKAGGRILAETTVYCENLAQRGEKIEEDLAENGQPLNEGNVLRYTPVPSETSP